jgi:hypothetical protein
MAKRGKFASKAERKHRQKAMLSKSGPTSGKDIFRREEHFRIAPKHPGMGRR